MRRGLVAWEEKLKLDIVDLDRFVEVNNCPEVTGMMLFDQSGAPAPDGLLSYELFGRYGSYDRRTIFGYIDLKGEYLHPAAYKALVALDRKIASVVDGSKYYKISEGQLVEDDKEGNTGLAWLKANIGKLRWRETGSAVRKERVDFIQSLKPNEMWVKKWLVCPAFYRDVNLADAQKGKIVVGELNEIYAKIIGLASAAGAGTMSFVGDATRGKLQLSLQEIYAMMLGDGGYLPKKDGIIHRGILGKAVDYACRSVIAAPRISADRPEDMRVTFRRTAIPLGQVCVLFFPIIVKEVLDFLRLGLGGSKYYEDQKGQRHGMSGVLSQLQEPEIKRMINDFIKTPSGRFDQIRVVTDEGKVIGLGLHEDDLKRKFTVTDLLYVCALRAVKGRHVLITRYPVEHHQNIHPSEIHVLTTRKTIEVKLGDKLFPDYPEVLPDYPDPESLWVDVVQMSNSYLEALNGDYDGDTVSIRALYTQEANEECARVISSPKNFLDSSGQNIRTLKNEGVLAIYRMTK